MECLEEDKPLLLKLTVNLLPVGFMIVIPTYMLVDGGRDIRWSKLTEVMKALGASRLGAGRLAAREGREAELIRIHEANQFALKEKYSTERRMAYIIKEVGLDPDTEDRTIRERIKQARELLKIRNEEGVEDPAVWDPNSYRAAYAEWQKTAPPRESVKLKKVKARVEALSSEDKAEFMKWFKTQE